MKINLDTCVYHMSGLFVTEIPHPIPQYCTQNVNHLSGPLKYPTWFTNIALKMTTT
jgi:hypothetical protein